MYVFKLYPPSMRVIVPGYLHSDNDIGLGSVWGLLIFHDPQKKEKISSTRD